MAENMILHALNDWSALDENEALWQRLDLSHPDWNFGIHVYAGRLWTGGFVGVGRLYGAGRRPLRTDGREHIAVITPQYGLSPWRMLAVVMEDDEYPDYMAQLAADGKVLFEVFYDEPPIRLAQKTGSECELFYAVGFLQACYSVCKKGLKRTMLYHEENCTAKVRGKINIKKNVRENTCRGRNERMYCKYIDFTEDNTENRILKAALLKCKKILAGRFGADTQPAKQLHYCLHALRRVKDVRVRTSDFAKVSVTGLYQYYKPALAQARCIHSQKYAAYRAADGKAERKSVYTVPYRINMETLFEFYARALLKKALPASCMLQPYSRRLFLQKDVSGMEETEKKIHLMPYCIPDMIICERAGGRPVAVLDAKYKSHARAQRADSLQLLAYVLLTGVSRCGFLFPGEKTQLKQMQTTGTDFLALSAGKLRYYELVLGDGLDEAGLERILDGSEC